jgi:hypothetical protein
MIASGRREYIAIFLDHSTLADCKRVCGEASVSEPPTSCGLEEEETADLADQNRFARILICPDPS